MATKKQDSGNTTYLLIMGDGTKRKFTCPTRYKLTFGPLVPGSKDTTYNSREALVLRVYDGPNQKAVFTSVASFRDTSLQFEEEIVQSKAETFQAKDENGNERQVVVEGAIRRWINPDAPKADPAGGPLRLKGIPEDLKDIRG